MQVTIRQDGLGVIEGSGGVSVSHEAVHRWTVSVLSIVGLSEEDADVVAQSLLFAERRGISGHGLVRLEVYVQRLRSGGINPKPQMRLVEDNGAAVVLDGDDGPGAVVASHAVEIVGSRVNRFGLAGVAVRNTGHFGAAGFYVGRISSQGNIGVITCNSDPLMAPPGGGDRVLGSNPVAIALPGPEQLLLDMALTTASAGKLIWARERNTSIPEGWAVDRTGAPTTDPAAGLDGALLPAAGGKGFGLALMLDALAAGLSGGYTSPDVGPLFGADSRPQRLSILAMAISPAFFVGSQSFEKSVRHIVSAVRSSRPSSHAAGQPVLPGERGNRHESAIGSRLTIANSVIQQLSRVGSELDIPFPSARGQNETREEQDR